MLDPFERFSIPACLGGSVRSEVNSSNAQPSWAAHCGKKGCLRVIPKSPIQIVCYTDVDDRIARLGAVMVPDDCIEITGLEIFKTGRREFLGAPNPWCGPLNGCLLVEKPTAVPKFVWFEAKICRMKVPRPRHSYTPNTFRTSSPKWLITLTAILPVCGLGNGRDVSE